MVETYKKLLTIYGSIYRVSLEAGRELLVTYVIAYSILKYVYVVYEIQYLPLPIIKLRMSIETEMIVF